MRPSFSYRPLSEVRPPKSMTLRQYSVTSKLKLVSNV